RHGLRAATAVHLGARRGRFGTSLPLAFAAACSLRLRARRRVLALTAALASRTAGTATAAAGARRRYTEAEWLGLAVRTDAVKMRNAGHQRRNCCHADEPSLDCTAQELHDVILSASGSFVKLVHSVPNSDRMLTARSGRKLRTNGALYGADRPLSWLAGSFG